MPASTSARTRSGEIGGRTEGADDLRAACHGHNPTMPEWRTSRAPSSRRAAPASNRRMRYPAATSARRGGSRSVTAGRRSPRSTRGLPDDVRRGGAKPGLAGRRRGARCPPCSAWAPTCWCWPGSTPAGRRAAAAERLGRELAAQHAASAEQFGAPWPGFAGRLRLRNDAAPGWAEFFAATRLLPLIAAARDGGALDARAPRRWIGSRYRLADARRAARAAGPPARRPVVGQPAVDVRSGLADRPGGLWRPPRDRPRDARPVRRAAPRPDPRGLRRGVSPLAAGWRERIGLHQLHPLLAHAVMFGAGYGDRAAALARRYA